MTRPDTRPTRPIRRSAAALLGAALTGTALTGTALTCTALPADASPTDPPISSYPVAFTGGIGVYLRSAPTDTADSKIYAVPDGTMIPVECETTGTPRTNNYNQTSDVYVRAPGGVYVASVYLDNGVLGRTGAADCDDLDAARVAARTPKTAGDLLRSGADVVYTTDGPNRLRGYYSHTKTSQLAHHLDQAATNVDVINNALCTAAGVLLAIATDGTALAASTTTTAGAGLGFGCGLISRNQVRPISDTANAADATSKCLELRFHRDGENWTLDNNGWTMTDNHDYCG